MSIEMPNTQPVDLPRLRVIAVGCQVTIANDVSDGKAAHPAERPQASPPAPESGQSIDVLA